MAKDGSPFDLRLPDAILMTESQNNLVSLGLLAHQGIETRIAPGDEPSELRFPNGRTVQLINSGVLVIPDALAHSTNGALACSAASSGQPNGRLSYEVLHNRFNGRRREALRDLPTALSDVTRDWES